MSVRRGSRDLASMRIAVSLAADYYDEEEESIMTAIAKRHGWDVLPTASADDDAKVDETLLESFPASDAPRWTLGVSWRWSSWAHCWCSSSE
jgi:hypothetical protein